MPRIYDFSVDHDNVLYDRASSARNTPPSTLINESSLSSLSSSDSWLGSLPISGLEFSEFESFGSYLYDQFNAKSEAWPISEDFVLILPPAPPFSSDNNIIDNISEEVGPTRENEFVQPSYYTPPTPRATPPPFQVATALSPTPSLSSSTPSTFSSSSPPSIVDEDATKSEEEDPEYIPSSCNRPKKRNASALSETPTKRPKILTTPVSCSSTDAARFPCTVPGCKQVCKTLET
ncbi:hypothetical protein B0F90DRAFT_1125704 [Multifurca ochricompacta]|uniref:Uncharacterized protein n=1 Tax=Multifurca ochricompacta TaxID=376703 RepID=A0AAD4LYY7_9AGAM|nr:hypothetical protein B0F90DRAFT_1125704 [Multifurca ochricompacta]